MNDDAQQPGRPMSRVVSVVARAVLLLLVLSAYSVGSWYTIDTLVNQHEGQCVGPLCIQPRAP